MITESPIQMMPRQNLESNGNFEDGLGKELEMMLRGHRNSGVLDRERELNIYRSGSAPPTVEGSLNAVGSLFRAPDSLPAHQGNAGGHILSDEALQSHPDYPSYYYSLEDLNPRLPPPPMSKEDWRFAQRLQAQAQAGAASSSAAAAFGGIGDSRKKDMVDDGVRRSLFSSQPGIRPPQKGECDSLGSRKFAAAQRNLPRQPSAEWLERDTDGLIGLAGVGLGARRKSLADMLQEGLGRSTVSGHLSRPVNPNGFDDVVDQMGVSDAQLAHFQNGLEAVDGLRSGATGQGLVRVQSFGSSVSNPFATALGSSLSRSTTPDPQLIRRSPSPCLPPVGGRVPVSDKKTIGSSNAFNVVSSCMTDPADVAAALSGLSLTNSTLVDEESRVRSHMQQDFNDQSNFLFDRPNGHAQSLQQQLVDRSEADSLTIPGMPVLPYGDLSKSNGVVAEFSASKMCSDGQVNIPKRSSSFSNLLPRAPATGPATLERSSIHYQNTDIPNMDFNSYNGSGYSINQRQPSVINRQFDADGAEGQSSHRSGNIIGPGLQLPSMDPLYAQYRQRTSDYAAQANANLNDPVGRSYMSTSQVDLLGLQKAYIGALLAQQKSQHGMPFSGKSGGLSHGYYASPAFGQSVPYPVSSVLHPAGVGGHIRQSERLLRFPSMMRSATGEALGSWHSENGGTMEEYFASSLLEEFKSNKTRPFELSDIVDHVVEFSVDQYGSRFIQQKLETASVEEKDKIFPEIISHARTLMTDVFGNYVIQKFFEHGTESQRKELASQLTGHVLPLSLQMYGCRVIQKALEVVDVDTQTQMVSELDGSVMKCVRDQNGNHVIQKSIECVPQEKIQFIISSFYGQVVALSTHPYGCRVIQRVLEHCDDPETQRIMMEEILLSVCTLAQDQYGNYVVQHVLQHGKQHERSAIINKLAGQIVKMSQQKFASNVVEKCLTFGGPQERQLLVNEMLGTTDENEPLQAMMKDQFANYVVQKVLETCDDQSRELILSRIKVHLNALKRYTYGKHIVARVEKLITAGVPTSLFSLRSGGSSGGPSIYTEIRKAHRDVGNLFLIISSGVEKEYPLYS